MHPARHPYQGRAVKEPGTKTTKTKTRNPKLPVTEPPRRGTAHACTCTIQHHGLSFQEHIYYCSWRFLYRIPQFYMYMFVQTNSRNANQAARCAFDGHEPQQKARKPSHNGACKRQAINRMRQPNVGPLYGLPVLACKPRDTISHTFHLPVGVLPGLVLRPDKVVPSRVVHTLLMRSSVHPHAQPAALFFTRCHPSECAANAYVDAPSNRD